MLDWDINWLAVLVAVVVTQALGFLWYGPLFGKQWIAASGRTSEEIQAEGPGPAMVVAVVAGLLQVVALALIIELLANPELMDGLGWGLIVGAAFCGATTVTAGVFQGTNSTVTWLYFGYQVVAMAIAGAILGAWQ
jgi:hypothetical protein